MDCEAANSRSIVQLRDNFLPIEKEIEINETFFTAWDSYANLLLPVTKVYINNREAGQNFFENEWQSIKKFVKKYGNYITHVRIYEFSSVFSNFEWQFFERLPNLESLTIESLNCVALSVLVESCNSIYDGTHLLLNATDPYPKNIFKVRELKFNVDAENYTHELYVFSMILPQYVLSLEVLGHTYWPSLNDGDEIRLGDILDHVKEYIILNKRSFGVFQQYDMSNFFDLSVETIRNFANEIQDFLNVCWDYDIDLNALNSSTLEVVQPLSTGATNILSLRNIHAAVSVMQLRRLDSITLKTSCSSINQQMIRKGENQFKKLTKIKIVVDSIELQEPTYFNEGVLRFARKCTTNDLLNFLFANCYRRFLSDLQINYDDTFVKSCDNDKIPLIDIKISLSTYCPNLTKLSLINWPGTNETILDIWKSFHLLQEISFDACLNLGDYGFVGDDTQNPLCLYSKSMYKNLNQYFGIYYLN